jgi:hypothetical protein
MSSLKNVAKLKHLGRTVEKDNYNQEKIKNGLNMENIERSPSPY